MFVGFFWTALRFYVRCRDDNIQEVERTGRGRQDSGVDDGIYTEHPTTRADKTAWANTCLDGYECTEQDGDEGIVRAVAVAGIEHCLKWTEQQGDAS